MMMVNKCDSAWISLAECFAEKPGMALSAGIMTGDWMLCALPDGKVCWKKPQLDGCIYDSVEEAFAGLGREDRLLFPNGERMTVAEARERMKPQRPRGIQVGDCVRIGQSQSIMRCQNSTKKGFYYDWWALPHIYFRGTSGSTLESIQAVCGLGDAKIASWSDALRWLLAQEEGRCECPPGC